MAAAVATAGERGSSLQVFKSVASQNSLHNMLGKHGVYVIHTFDIEKYSRVVYT